MKNLNGGYSMIDLTSATLLVDLANALALGKPVLAYDSNGKGNFYTLKENDGAYTLVGADLTYNVSDEGVVTSKSTHPDLYYHNVVFNIGGLPEGYTIEDNGELPVTFTSTRNTPYDLDSFKAIVQRKRVFVGSGNKVTYNDKTLHITRFVISDTASLQKVYFDDGTDATFTTITINSSYTYCYKI